MKAMASEGTNTQYPIWIGEDNLLYSDLSRLEDHLRQLLSYTGSEKTAEFAKIIQMFLNKQHIDGKSVRLSMHGFPKLLTWIILRSMCAKDIQILCSDSANNENTAFDNIKEAISTEQWYELLQIKDGLGKTPLHWAAYRDSTEMVIQLLHDMSDDQKWELLRSKNMYEKTPLHEAVYQRHPQMVRVLLGFFPTANCARLRRLLQDRDSSGKTLLIWAAQQGHTETVQVMLNAIVKSNLQGRLLAMTDETGQTILHCAACKGHTEVLRSIKGFLKPDEWHNLVKKQDCSGFSSLLSGVSQGHVRIAELIKELVSAAVWLELLNMKDSTGSTCLLWAAWSGDTELIKLFLMSLSSDQCYQALTQYLYIGWTVLHRAVWLGKKEVVHLIHESLSADPDRWCQLLQMRDKSGRTALHLAVWKSSTDLMWYIFHTLEEEQWISLLEAKDDHGFTALYMAGYRHMVPSKDITQTDLRRTMVLSLKKSVNDPKVWDDLLSARTPSARQLKGIANKEVYLKAIESLKDFGETVSKMEKEDYEDPATYKPDDRPSTSKILKMESEDNAADSSKTTLLGSESTRSADERSNHISTPEYEKLVQALTNAAARVPTDLSISNQQVQLNRIQDSIFKEVREFGADISHQDSGKTMSCILITRVDSNCGEEHSHRFETDNMLIVVQGDISISHHFFNRGREISWQISGMKCWNEHLREVLNEVQTPESEANSIRLPHLMVTPFTSGHDSIPSTIQRSVQGNLCSYRSRSINFLLESDNDELTAKFQLLHNGMKINDVVSCFEDYQSSSECSDAHHIIELVDQLDVDEDERPVTVVVMAASTEDGDSKYLLQLIAGHLKKPVVRPTDEFWKEIQTHYVGNDSLYEEIVRRCDEGLENLIPDKKEKLVSEGASFVVSSSFPVVDIDGEFKITDVIQATIEISDDSREVYNFQTEETLCFRLHEPSSPPEERCRNGAAAASSSLDVQQEDLLAKLHEAHYNMFTQLREFHDTQLNLENAVTAITSVACLADGSTQGTLFLLKGVWYGSGIEDRQGWRVSVIPLLSSALTAHFEPSERNGRTDQICKGVEPKLVDVCKQAQIVHNGIRLSIHRGSDHERLVTITSDDVNFVCAATFTCAEKSICCKIQQELLKTIPTELLIKETYQQKFPDNMQTREASNGGQTEKVEDDDENSHVMISVHVVRTMLEKKKKKNKYKQRSGLPHRITLNPGLQNTKIIILAIGEPDQLCIPQSFCYHDPLNCWRSESRFVNSPILKAEIEKRWAIFKRKNQKVPESVAKHIMLNGDLEEIPLILSGGKVKCDSKGKLLEYLSHAPDENSLDNVLKKSDVYKREKALWQSAGDDETFLRIKSNFFDEKRLPTSFKYDTIKIKHNILPRPNQQGANYSPSLHLHHHDEAHIKFTELVEPAQKLDDEAIKKKLKVDEN